MPAETARPSADTLFGPPAAGESGAPAGPAVSPVVAAVVFLARFLGTAVQAGRLEDTLAGLPPAPGGQLPPEALRRLLGAAGLVVSRLPANRPRRASELPALVLGGGGQAVVVLAMRSGRYECQVPGIDGSTWLSASALARELPEARWYAVRPRLHLDQRSLLYTLPEPARWFWDVFARNRAVFAWALLGTLALNLFGALVPFYAMAVYDRVIPHQAMGSLLALSTGVLLLIGFEALVRGVRSHLLDSAARRMDVALSARIFAQCLKLRSTSRPASGGVLANTVRDFEAVREFFANSTLTVLGDLPFVLLYLAVIVLVGGWLAAVPLATIPLLLGLAWTARGPLARRVNASMRESAQRTAHLFETMNALDTLKALGAEAWSRRKWEALTQAIAHDSLRTRSLLAHLNHGNAALMAVSGAAVVGAGAWLAAQQAVSLGQIIAVSLLTARALAPVAQLAGLIVRWEQTRLSYRALDQLMRAPTDEAEASLAAPPLSGALAFREASFAYPGQPPVLDRVSLDIRPGERVGVIGRLGSGKSSLLKLVLNQLAPTAGSVLVDGLVVQHLEPLSLRRQIGYVPQELTLFHGTLRENIELGRTGADDRALVAAMKAACVDELVAQLPEGPATPVGERGERLSGGQRQCVAIARALLGAPKLLLLDEPSSMVDPATEQKLIERLRALPDTTIVLVTHRMAMLALVDRLVVMERGRIVADGPRDQVLARLAQGAPAGSGQAPAPRPPLAEVPRRPAATATRPAAADAARPPAPGVRGDAPARPVIRSAAR